MTTNKKTALAKRLIKYRKQAGYSSPEKLAEAIDNPTITKSTIVNLEQGRKNDMTVTEMLLLAKAFKIPAAALICDLDKPYEHPSIAGFEHYYNTDLLDLLDIEDTTYGPYTDSTTVSALSMANALPLEIQTIYSHIASINSCLLLIDRNKKNLMSAIAKNDKKQISRMTYSLNVERESLELTLDLLKKNPNIALPQKFSHHITEVIKSLNNNPLLNQHE